MAITKIKGIKSTLKKALDYIMNPEKTEERLLVSSYSCTPETADIEFEFTRSKGTGLGNKLAFHLIQSFDINEITAEEAHRIGKEFADKLLKGQHEYVISTHVDKGHIHIHIIFNSVNFTTHRKYHDSLITYKNVRKISDRLCKENGLSVIKNPSGIRGKGAFEYEQYKEGTSWKNQLKQIIDINIKESRTWEDFLERMKESECEIKQGKHISFRANGQERFCRGKTIGEYYTEEKIKDRIENKEVYQEWDTKNTKAASQEEKQKVSRKTTFDKTKINLLIDVQKNIKCQESEGYKYRIGIINLQEKTKTLNYLIQNNICTPEELMEKYKEMKGEYDDIRKKIKKIEIQMNTLSEQIKYISNYKKCKKAYQQASLDKSGKYLKEYEKEIIIFEAAQRYLKENNIDAEKFDFKAEVERHQVLKKKRDEMYDIFYERKDKFSKIDIIRRNIETILQQNLEHQKVESKEQSR